MRGSGGERGVERDEQGDEADIEEDKVGNDEADVVLLVVREPDDGDDATGETDCICTLG